MKNSEKVLQEICNELSRHHQNVRGSYEAYNTFECAIRKYGTTVSKLSLGIAEGVDYEKIIWQIVADLRRARDIDLDFDSEAAGYDSHYLMTIAEIIHEKGEYDGLISCSAINYDEYCEICKEQGLIE